LLEEINNPYETFRDTSMLQCIISE